MGTRLFNTSRKIPFILGERVPDIYCTYRSLHSHQSLFLEYYSFQSSRSLDSNIFPIYVFFVLLGSCVGTLRD